MFVRDPVQIAQKAAPFLTFNQTPYAVVNDGQIYWIVDGYTTTNQYPYSQNADTQQVASGSSLPGKLQLRAQLGEGGHQRLLGQDDVLQRRPERPDPPGLRGGLPEHVHPAVEDERRAQAHLRYPPDIFSIQSAIYGRYHLTSPSQFYAASNAWQLSPDRGCRAAVAVTARCRSPSTRRASRSRPARTAWPRCTR